MIYVIDYLFDLQITLVYVLTGINIIEAKENATIQCSYAVNEKQQKENSKYKGVYKIHQSKSID